ncbi:cytochrome c peroxidase [Photobacterium kasasachensis]|uniref:cytochrome c peroxidase n=1 Tax=Photobacterium kasasachensis TaxID=2910240 RepID=UPI003D0C3591
MENINMRKRARLGVFIAATGLLAASIQQAVAASPEKPSSYLPDNLPPVPGIEEYIKDYDAAIKLGKAFFWDMQTGSQGQSCGSCHFSAGADIRAKNQISPGVLSTIVENQDKFNYDGYPELPSGGKGGPNYTLTKDDYPLYQLEDNRDRDSNVVYETDDVVSSQGVSFAKFKDLEGNHYGSEFEDGKERCENLTDIFHVNNLNTRRVEPRNTPTVINAVYNFRNFWDGRANNIFNGVDPFGPHNEDAYVLYYDRKHGKTVPKKTHLINSSLASQAVGPPGSNFEMTCDGKPFKAMAKKLLRLKPLGLQEVHPNDSALGYLSAYPAKGLKTDYRTLIRDAFHEEFWMSPRHDEDGYTQIEHNFSLFWGLAIQMYESTLVSLGHSKFEKGEDLTPLELQGAQIFSSFGGPNAGRCIGCHGGPAFSQATLHLTGNTDAVITQGPVGPTFAQAVRDRGFMNIGVRPTVDDLGLGGLSNFGYPLSFTRQAQNGETPDGELISGPVDPSARTAIDGAFKIPLLHNIELTGPFMHNGSLATLEEVIDFYFRGGNRRKDPNNPIGDTSGHNGTASNLVFNLGPLPHLNDDHKKALVAFLKSLTDERVRWEKAPFDRPQLFIPVGHIGDEYSVQDDGTGKAEVQWVEIPSVGKEGRYAENLPPIKGFLEESSEEPEAYDDYGEVKYPHQITINLMANDKAGSAPLDYSSVKIVEAPDMRYGVLTNHGDGKVSYRPMRNMDTSFTYQIKDKNGLFSSPAKVEIKVSR